MKRRRNRGGAACHTKVCETLSVHLPLASLSFPVTASTRDLLEFSLFKERVHCLLARVVFQTSDTSSSLL